LTGSQEVVGSNPIFSTEKALHCKAFFNLAISML